MKRKIASVVSLLLLALLLTACQAEQAASAELEPPLDEVDATISVPDFLDEEQQLLYRRAYSLYRHMWGGETSAIDYYPLQEGAEPKPNVYETIEIDGWHYLMSYGRYQNWDDFISVIYSVFTEESFQARNEIDEIPIYRSYEGRLCLIDASKGSNMNYNTNFPDEFELVYMSDELIQFNVIGHFSEGYPVGDETDEERDERVASGYEYTATAPIEMVKTEDGWHFSVFNLVADFDAGQLNYFLNNLKRLWIRLESRAFMIR